MFKEELRQARSNPKLAQMTGPDSKRDQDQRQESTCLLEGEQMRSLGGEMKTCRGVVRERGQLKSNKGDVHNCGRARTSGKLRSHKGKFMRSSDAKQTGSHLSSSLVSCQERAAQVHLLPGGQT